MHKNLQDMISINDVSELPFHIDITILDNIIDVEDEEIIKQKVQKLMEQLTDRQREAIYLRYMQEMDYDEIAIILNMTGESARKLVYRAIGKLRELVGDDLLLLFIMSKMIFDFNDINI